MFLDHSMFNLVLDCSRCGHRGRACTLPMLPILLGASVGKPAKRDRG